ncbi:MAG: response regulator [Burkholderiales bacterium]
MKPLDAEILAARLLIVDDQEVNVALLTRLLAEAGYTHVDSTLTSSAVCALHRANHYDLILLDLQMPEMDGFQVMEALKTSEADDYLPVLVITAQPGHKLRALKAGARDFVSKPFDLVEVGARIRNMLEVRLLYKALATLNASLEHRIEERTAELRESEARFRSLTRLAADWYWEQDESGRLGKVSGPVLEMLGIRVDPLVGTAAPTDTEGWDEGERRVLLARIEAREPFLDLHLNRVDANGLRRRFRVSGEPILSATSRFIGYRGIGTEIDADD